MEKFSTYSYHVLPDQLKRGWYYEIYSVNGKKLIETNPELFASEGTARYAAIGHIHLLEEANRSQSGRS
jgi:hypothetical protein